MSPPGKRQSYEEVLEERAEKLSHGATLRHERQIAHRVATLRIGAEIVGIPATSCHEIILRPAITMLPHLPAYLRGVIQRRGKLVSVAHTAELLEVESDGIPEYLAVVEGTQGPLGLLCDEVLGFREIFTDELAQTLHRSSALAGQPILAVTKDMVVILDLERLLGSKKLVVR